MRRLLAAIAVLAALATLWLVADAWRASRIPRSGRPIDTVEAVQPPVPDSTPSTPATPSAPPAAVGARLAIDWQDSTGQQYRSEIILEPNDRKPVAATVITHDRGSNQELVRYHAKAVRLAGGTLIIDAEGTTASGPYAAEWSPDSFTIASDGQVTTQDAQNSPCSGWVVQEDGFTP